MKKQPQPKYQKGDRVRVNDPYFGIVSGTVEGRTGSTIQKRSRHPIYGLQWRYWVKLNNGERIPLDEIHIIKETK